MSPGFADAFRSAARRLRRQPAFFALTSGSLALALGAATAAFGFADAWRHPTVPYDSPERTFRISMWGGPAVAYGGLSGPDRWRQIERTSAFEQRALSSVQTAVVEVGGASASSPREPVATVTANFFAVVGVRPRLGRAPAPGEGDASAVVVSDYYWRRYFANRETIGDAGIRIGDVQYRIVGVMPRGMQYGHIWYVDIWRLMTAAEESDGGLPTVRAKPGTTLTGLQAELDATAKVMNARLADQSRPYGYTIRPIVSDRERRLDGFHFVMMMVALFILFIACANVTALFLARASARRRDLALRLSLGARHGVLVADLAAELLIIALAGTLAGLVVAAWATKLLTVAIPPELSWSLFLELNWSWRVFGAAGVLLLATVAFAGFLPALQMVRIAPIDPLKESSAGTTAKVPRRMRSVVMVQLALSLVMLIETSLLLRVVAEQSNFDFGFNPRPVISAAGRFVYRWDLDRLRGQSPVDFLMPRAAAVPGVTLVSWYGSGTPDGLQVTSDDIGRDGHPLMAGRYTIAGPHFIQTLGVPMIAGRDFIEGDDAGTGAVILDDSAAKALFPTGSPIGRRVRLGRASSAEPWRPVIGVVRSAWLPLPNAPPSNRWPRVYVAMPNPEIRVWGLVARADSSAQMTALRIKRELASVLPLSVQATVAPLTAQHDASIRSQRQLVALFGTLAGGALLFAAAGLFAVLSYVVSQRMREFGIRVAIGAQRADLLRLVMRDALEMALGGTAIGGMIGVAGTAVVAPFIFGVDFMSVVALVAAEATLIGVTLLASLVPALRATRADAVDVLRAT